VALNIPTGVTSNGTVQVHWVPTIADPNNPNVTEISAASALDISCYLTADGLTLSADETTTTNRRLCSKQEYTIGGTITWSIGALRYVWDPQGLYTDTHDAYQTLAPDSSGYLVVRWGRDAETPIAAADVVDVFAVTLGEQVPQTPEANSELYVTQVPKVTGSVYRDVTVAPAPGP
jgi:hypothetical protein